MLHRDQRITLRYYIMDKRTTSYTNWTAVYFTFAAIVLWVGSFIIHPYLIAPAVVVTVLALYSFD